MGTAVDGERLAVITKDMGTAEIFPQYVAHHPNGRLFAVCGDGDYVVYTSQALRNKSYGSALEFVWGHSGAYATRDTAGKVSVFQDFKESFSFKPPFHIDEMFGGRLIAVRSGEFVCFYDWTSYRLVRRIDVAPRSVIWSDDGCSVVLVCPDSFYILKHDKSVVQAALAGQTETDDDGIEASFDLQEEVSDKVVSGLWVGECFVYIAQSQRMICMVAGATETLAHLDRPQYLLGYLPEQSKLYLIDKELSITPYTLHLALVEYQSAIMRKDTEAAAKYFSQLPETTHNRVARFLESQGYTQEALEVSQDGEHRFELTMKLDRLHMAADIIVSIEQSDDRIPLRSKWKTLGDVAMEQADFVLAKRCFLKARDLNALFLLQTSCGDAEGLRTTAKEAQEAGVANIACLCHVLLGDLVEALDILVKASRLPEACFFCPKLHPERATPRGRVVEG